MQRPNRAFTIDFFMNVCYNGSMDMQKPKSSAKPLKIIGNSVIVKIADIQNIPAKVDTGATISSVWASDISLTPNNQLEFCLFAPESQLYTGEKITVNEYSVRKVRNSTGQEEIRYMVVLPTVIRGKKIRVTYTLADRSKNDFPVLVGRRALNKKFLVDVSKLAVPYQPRPINDKLNQELQANPQAFHKKYMQKGLK